MHFTITRKIAHGTVHRQGILDVEGIQEELENKKGRVAHMHKIEKSSYIVTECYCLVKSFDQNDNER